MIFRGIQPELVKDVFDTWKYIMTAEYGDTLDIKQVSNIKSGIEYSTRDLYINYEIKEKEPLMKQELKHYILWAIGSEVEGWHPIATSDNIDEIIKTYDERGSYYSNVVITERLYPKTIVLSREEDQE